MKKLLWLIVFLIVGGGVANSPFAEETAGVWGTGLPDKPTVDMLKESFAINKEDTVMSGLSVIYATDMVANGASGKSLAQLTGFLGDSVENTNAKLHDQMKHLPKTLEISNGIWGNGFQKSYVSVLKKVLNVSAEPLPANTSTINNWVKKKTHGKVSSVLEEEPTEPNHMYLVNTIYFKDNWKWRFGPWSTRERVFHSLSGVDRNVLMMSQEKNFDYAENDVMQSVRMPYENGGYMIVYLPKEDVDFNTFISELTPEKLDLEYTLRGVELSIPKFKLAKEVNIKELFQNMGIQEIFRQENHDLARFSGKPAYVKEIRHKAVVDVNEMGTIAAAVTDVVLAERSAPMYPVSVVVDRPFLFFITQGNFLGIYTGNAK